MNLWQQIKWSLALDRTSPLIILFHRSGKVSWYTAKNPKVVWFSKDEKKREQVSFIEKNRHYMASGAPVHVLVEGIGQNVSLLEQYPASRQDKEWVNILSETLTYNPEENALLKRLVKPLPWPWIAFGGFLILAAIAFIIFKDSVLPAEIASALPSIVPGG